MARGVFGLALLLGAVSMGWLAAVASREPDYGRPPRLISAVDGGAMEEFLAGPDEKATILAWVERGAREDEWAEVSVILERRCVTCHFEDETQFEMVPLDRYESVAAAARVRPVLEEKLTGGTMGEYLETREEQSAVVAWIASGAPEAGWPRVREILAAYCVQCHNPDGVAGLPRLDGYRSAARLAHLPEPEPVPLAGYAAPAFGVLASVVLAASARRRREKC